MEKLVLIDGNSLINRAFYAMPLLTTKDGKYTNAVFGFMNMLFKILNFDKPDYLAVAFDLKAPTFRHKMYSEYKGTRKPMPEELRPQIPLLKDVLKSFGICTLEKEGFEADDIIGTVAKSTDFDTYIYTGDKDSFQLVDDTTSVCFTKRGITDTELLNIKNFKEKTLLLPFQIIELKALMGDSSDNIPGVKGIGEKTAISLLQSYESVDNLYSHIDELTGKLKEKIEQGKDFAYLSKTLATIDVHAPIDFQTEKMKLNIPFSETAGKTLMDLEFYSLYKKEESFFKKESVKEKVPETKTEIIFVENISTPFIPENRTYAFYIGEDEVGCSNGEKAFFIKVRKTLLDDGEPLSSAITYFGNLFSFEGTLVLFDKKKTRRFLSENLGLDISAKTEDVSIMKYLASFSGKDDDFSAVSSEYLKQDEKPAVALYEIYSLLKDKIKEENLTELYEKIELPLSDVLFEMEKAGFKVDIEALNETGEKYREILSELEKEIRDLTGESELNVNSPKQLGEVLFEKLKIAKGKKTKTGYSTSADFLENLEDKHPVIPIILKYRKIQKLQSTYVEGLKPLIDKTTGLIHTSFNQTVTATGRLSSSEPNLQNIPIRDEEGNKLRKFFVPKSSNRMIIGADYSQIELRLLAAFSDCQALINAFNCGEDVHKETASKVFKVPMDKVTSAMRRSAKAVNFGIIYGISEYGLAKNIKVSPKEAAGYIDSYFNEYPEIKGYMNALIASAKDKGYAETMMGRRRYIRELQSQNYNLRQFGERVAMNMPLQGSAADIIKVAMINVFSRLKKEGLKSELILQVHDELIIDAAIDEEEKVKKILKEEMEGAVDLKVKLTVEIAAGKTWFDAK